MSSRKDHEQVLRCARRAGWSVELRKGGHYKLTCPDGRPYFSAGSPSDHRALLNLRADLRKMGLETDPRRK